MLDAFEIDMLSLGDADCILATGWNAGKAVRILIDGGKKGDYQKVRTFLRQRGANFLNAVISTHPHDDHVGGLLELVRDKTIAIGNAFVHIPQFHIDPVQVQKALRAASGSPEADCIRKSLATARDLVEAFKTRGITPIEPFAGTQIEFLTVVGPSVEYYNELITEFSDAEAMKKVDAQNTYHKVWSALHDQATDVLDTELPANPETTPENNSSVILAFLFGTEKYLFTADAGVPALQKVVSGRYDLTKCYWMQIPHHGSRRNINPALIQHFSPAVAWVSADGNKKHPRRAVVNAFRQAGTKVYSTHYPNPTSMWIYRGSVPRRTNYGSHLVSLYEKPLSTLPPPPGINWLSSPSQS